MFLNISDTKFNAILFYYFTDLSIAKKDLVHILLLVVADLEFLEITG